MSRAIAVLLLVASWGIPLALPHVSTDDLLCLDLGGGDGPRQSRMDIWDGRATPDHCVICHAARTFRTSLVEAGPVAVGLVAGHVLAVLPAAPHAATSFTRLPARAPPSLISLIQ